MADGIVQLPFTNTTSGKIMDASELVVGVNTVERERMVLADPTAAAGFAPVTTSGGVSVNVTNPTTGVTISNPTTAVSLSSTPTVVLASSGITQVLTSGTLLVVNTSSGLVQTLSTGAILLSSAGLTQVFTSVGTPLNVFTMSSGGSLVRSLSSGTVTLSSNPTVVNASSGVVQALTSGTLVVVNVSSGTVQVLTSGTLLVVSVSSGFIQLTSAPVIQSASSGIVQIVPSSGATYSIFTFNASSSNSVTNITAVATRVFGWNVGSQFTGQVCVRLFNSTAPTVGSTTNLQQMVPIPASTAGAGAGNNFWSELGVNYTSALSFYIVDNFSATSTALGHNAGDVGGTIYYL